MSVQFLFYSCSSFFYFPLIIAPQTVQQGLSVFHAIPAMEINAFVLLYTHTFSVSPFRMRENFVSSSSFIISRTVSAFYSREKSSPKKKKKKLLLPVTASQRYRTPQHILAERFTVKKARRFMYIISGEEENNDSKNEDWQLSAQMQYKCFMCAHTKKKS